MTIPNAPYYVLCNDSFMSGWGYASGKINTLILPCESYDQALIVAQNAHNRSDQKYVRILSHKPKLRHSTHFYSVHGIDSYPHWYEVGYFKK